MVGMVNILGPLSYKSSENALNISIMRKETLTLETDSQRAQQEIMKEFKECIAFSRASKLLWPP